MRGAVARLCERESRHRGCDAAHAVGRHHGVVARVRRLHVGQGQGGAGWPRSAGACCSTTGRSGRAYPRRHREGHRSARSRRRLRYRLRRDRRRHRRRIYRQDRAVRGEVAGGIAHDHCVAAPRRSTAPWRSNRLWPWPRRSQPHSSALVGRRRGARRHNREGHAGSRVDRWDCGCVVIHGDGATVKTAAFEVTLPEVLLTTTV